MEKQGNQITHTHSQKHELSSVGEEPKWICHGKVGRRARCNPNARGGTCDVCVSVRVSSLSLKKTFQRKEEEITHSSRWVMTFYLSHFGLTTGESKMRRGKRRLKGHEKRKKRKKAGNEGNEGERKGEKGEKRLLPSLFQSFDRSSNKDHNYITGISLFSFPSIYTHDTAYKMHLSCYFSPIRSPTLKNLSQREGWERGKLIWKVMKSKAVFPSFFKISKNEGKERERNVVCPFYDLLLPQSR